MSQGRDRLLDQINSALNEVEQGEGKPTRRLPEVIDQGGNRRPPQQQSSKPKSGGGGGQQPQKPKGGGTSQARGNTRYRDHASWVGYVLYAFQIATNALTLSLVINENPARPDWWNNTAEFIPFAPEWLTGWLLILLSLSVILQATFTYLPRYIAINGPYGRVRIATELADSMFDYIGLYVGLEMLGFVPDLERIRVFATENMTISGVVALLLIVLAVRAIRAWKDAVIDTRAHGG
jgi:hypothetical protein